MSKFMRELLVGIGIAFVGILLSISSGYILFYGIIIVGLFMIILAFVHRSQGKSSSKDGDNIKKIYPTDKPQEKLRFIQNISLQEDLDAPKQISISCSRKDQAGAVFLNGEKMGMLTPDSPLVFNVTKKNNVVNISEHYEGICFFCITDTEGVGELKVGIGMQSAAVKVVSNTGLKEGIYETQTSN